MPETDNKAVTTPHDELLSRATQRFPDRRFGSQSGQDGQEGQEGQDDLEQAILDMMTESEARIAENDSKNAQLVNLFASDPVSAEFVSKFIETFGDDLEELSTEEGRSKFSEDLQGWRDRRAENDRMNEEADANWQQSLSDLDAWGNEKGMDDDQKAAVILRLIKIASEGLMNKYGREDFEMVYKETNYDSAVASARSEGEIAGRNAKIAETRRERSAANTMPPSPSGQGIRAREPRPAPQRSVWSGIK